MDIFISYRRADSPTHAGRIHDLLKQFLGAENVFMDVENLAPGDKFIDVISSRLSACKVFIPVIGPKWLNARRGLRWRLGEPNDFVRLEIKAALAREIKVIPVLVAGLTKMPDASELPDSISGLANFQSKTILEDQFFADVMKLVDIIKPVLQASPAITEDIRQQEYLRVAAAIEADRKMYRDRRDRFTRRSFLSATSIALVGATGWGAIHFDTFGQSSKRPAFGALPPAPPRRPDGPVLPTAAPGGFTPPAALAFPEARGGTEPVLKLADIWDDHSFFWGGRTRAVTKSGKIVFHAVGSTGFAKTGTENPAAAVADSMAEDFRKPPGAVLPSFLLNLGDVILYFGEAQLYAEQFYQPYKHYPAPIMAIAGNHDGAIAPDGNAPTLKGFLENFCAAALKVSPSAPNDQWDRPAQIQPGVYFTFEAPFVRILALYSNVLEGPGVISSAGGQFPVLGNRQHDFLRAALSRVQQEKFRGAVIVAAHHNSYHPGHGGSPDMQLELDGLFHETGVWPHAVLSGHAHNYQRYTRTEGTMQIPFITAGGGGAGVAKLSRPGAAPVALPLPLADRNVALEAYDDQQSGFLRLTADNERLQIEYCQVGGGDAARDVVTVDLATRKLIG